MQGANNSESTWPEVWVRLADAGARLGRTGGEADRGRPLRETAKASEPIGNGGTYMTGKPFDLGARITQSGALLRNAAEALEAAAPLATPVDGLPAEIERIARETRDLMARLWDQGE